MFIYSNAKNRRSGTTMQRMPLRGSLSRAESAREVLAGYPLCTPFESRESIEEYLAGDEVTCLLCGKAYKMLAPHIKRIHQLDADDYRWRYNIPAYFGLVGKSTSEKKQALSSRPERIAFVKALGKTVGGFKGVVGRKCKLVLDEAAVSMKQRSGEMSALIKHRPGGTSKYHDWSWHLEQARNHFYYKHIISSPGVGSWSAFKKRRLVDAELNVEFERARQECVASRPGHGWQKPTR